MRMIEKVARAIAKSQGFELPNDMSLPYADGSRVGKVMMQSRAAIEAMRQPSEYMEKAAYLHDDSGAPLSCAYDEIYTVMIDAALNE